MKKYNFHEKNYTLKKLTGKQFFKIVSLISEMDFKELSLGGILTKIKEPDLLNDIFNILFETEDIDFMDDDFEKALEVLNDFLSLNANIKKYFQTLLEQIASDSIRKFWEKIRKSIVIEKV